MNSLQKTDLPTVPSNWIIVNLEDIAEIGQGGTPSTDIQDYWDGKIPWLRSGEINFNRIISSQRKITKLGIQNSAAKLLPKGTLLLAMTGQGLTRGRAAILDIEASANQSCVHIIPKSTIIDNEYLFYFFMKEYWTIRQIYKGSNQAGLNTTLIKKLRIPLTSPKEQKQIVLKIKELFLELDNSIHALKTSLTLLSQYRQSVFKYAFSGKLSEEWRENHINEIIPISDFIERIINDENKSKTQKSRIIIKEDLPTLPFGWSWVRLSTVAVINPKFQNTEVRDHDQVSFLPMKDLEEETGKYNASIRSYSEVKKQYTPFRNNDIIFAKITPCMENGKITLLHNLENSIGFGSTEFHVIRVIEGLVTKYFLFYFLQKDFREKAHESMTGSAGQLRVPLRYLEQVLIPLPSIKEQDQIAREIQRRMIVSSDVLESVKQSLVQSTKLRQSILNAAYDGKLVQHSRADENLLELLEKSREDKTSRIRKSSKSRIRNKHVDTKQTQLV